MKIARSLCSIYMVVGLIVYIWRPEAEDFKSWETAFLITASAIINMAVGSWLGYSEISEQQLRDFYK